MFLEHGEAQCQPYPSLPGPGVSHLCSPLADDDYDSRSAMTIPIGHSTTTGSLLHMPQTSVLIGHYPQDLFLRVEQKRFLPRELSLGSMSSFSAPVVSLDRAVTDPLVHAYFSSVHPKHPVLDKKDFWQMYNMCSSIPSDNRSPEYALCLITLALAEVALSQPDVSVRSWTPGLTYFAPALQIVVQSSLISFGSGLVLPQCLFLAALYYSYLARPLWAWKLAHMASTNLQHLWVQ